MSDQKKRNLWARPRELLAKTGKTATLYLDDLLFLSGGGLLSRAAWEQFGRPAGMAVSGAFLILLAVIVAKSRKEGG